MRHSLASCLVETAHRMISTATSETDAQLKRAIGRELLGAEVLGIRRQPPENKTPYTQGLEVQLGVYDPESRRFLDDHERLVGREFSRTFGGFVGACVIATIQLRRADPQWLPTAFDVVTPERPRHLHRVMLEERADPGNKAFAQGSANGDRLRDNALLLIARRLRWRLSVDHAEPNSPPSLLYWSTPRTDEWVYRWLGSHANDTNWDKLFALLGLRLAGVNCRSDHAPNNPNDWGDVLLQDDPLTILTLGPWSPDASTHEDVLTTLQRATPQISICPQRLPKEPHQPVAAYAEALSDLAAELSDDAVARHDIVLLYRGGGLKDLTRSGTDDGGRRPIVTAQDKQALLAAATELAARGVEVVIGIGHGDLSVFPAGAQLPIGVFEAVTPTAAAEWILAEHVNTRLAGSGSGQPPPSSSVVAPRR